MPEDERKSVTCGEGRKRCNQVNMTPDAYCQTDEGRWIGVVKEFLKNLRYGEVTLTVHDSRVVQVEQTQKVRM